MILVSATAEADQGGPRTWPGGTAGPGRGEGRELGLARGPASGRNL